MRPEQTRTYDPASSVVFRKTDAPFGGLSNMAGGFPLRVNGTRILTSEALYQACRFPHLPEVQALIIGQRSPMTSKMKSKLYRPDSRRDWEQVRVKIMRWCLRVKLAQNWRAFSELLLHSGERPIVEESRRDDFWGAKANDDGTLVGTNVLGRLLMELREAIRAEGRESFMYVKPLAIPDFLLLGLPIGIVDSHASEPNPASSSPAVAPPYAATQDRSEKQSSLFDALAVKEALHSAYSRGIHVSDLKPYKETSDSGVPWLGMMPRHWEVRQARHIGRLMKGSGGNKSEARDSGVPCVRYGELYTAHHVFVRRARSFVSPERAAQYMPLQFGDVLFAASGEKIDEIGKSAVNLIEGNAVCGGDVVVLRPTIDVYAPFLGYAFGNRYTSTQKATMCRGTTIKHIYPDELRGLVVLLPPPAEQAAIVRFLDWANGRLERAIRAKRKMIALLGEQKQAIIHRAVTGGLDPTVPLKPSGIPWLGEIPAHWEVLPLKGVCAVQSGLTLGKDYGSQPLRRYPYLRVANVQAGHVNLSVVKSIRVTKAEAQRCMLQSGDVLMTEGGDLDKLGRGCVWEAQLSPCLHQNHVFAVRPNQSRLVPRFLSALMGTSYARAYFQSTAKQTTNLAATNKTKLGTFKVLLPRVDEQRRILARLDEELRPVNMAASRLEREIDLLREYRTRLVADVVTGKLDVREAAARLPDEAPLDSIEDETELTDAADIAEDEAVVE